MSDNPSYSFGDVKGIVAAGTQVSIGVDDKQRISISFTYRDSRDGCEYRVVAEGYREKIGAQKP